jgi:hypothetical protein
MLTQSSLNDICLELYRLAIALTQLAKTPSGAFGKSDRDELLLLATKARNLASELSLRKIGTINPATASAAGGAIAAALKAVTDNLPGAKDQIFDAIRSAIAAAISL